MVKINRIKEPVSTLLLDGEIIGKIFSSFELNDVLIQIKEQSLTGYSFEFEGINYPISSQGRVITEKQRPYPLLGQQLRKLI